jgi:diketogulonate reductase-like aldo/keto reductase
MQPLTRLTRLLCPARHLAILVNRVVVQAYSPLGSGGLLHVPLLQHIGAAHGKTAAQVALRWIYQHNATINTQSTSVTHLQQDVDIFDFSLTADEIKRLDAYQP